ncbi:MAG: thymidine kinase [Planctomycetota bacterium]
MAKLYFRYGTMGSAKTLNLLAVAHNYSQQNKKVILMKPKLDERFGSEIIHSRAGLSKKADVLLEPATRLNPEDFRGVDCILVDEAQFLSKSVIDQLREITQTQNIPIICYGLRTDFRSHLFEGSQRLIEVSDTIEEIKTTCAFCNKKAIFNLKHVNGKAVVGGPVVDLGAEEKYYPVCYVHYEKELKAAGTSLAQLQALKL